MPYKVTMQIRSQMLMDDELIDAMFDALTESVPPPLGCFDTEMSAKPGTCELEVKFELEDVRSIDRAGTWTLVAIRDAARKVDRLRGIDESNFEVTEQVIESWHPAVRDDDGVLISYGMTAREAESIKNTLPQPEPKKSPDWM